MNRVRDRQNYRWLENEVNNTNRVHSVKEIWFEDLASYLEENLGTNDSGFDAKIYGSKKIYDPEAIDVKVIESQVVSWDSELNDKSRSLRKWFDKTKKQVLSHLDFLGSKFQRKATTQGRI